MYIPDQLPGTGEIVPRATISPVARQVASRGLKSWWAEGHLEALFRGPAHGESSRGPAHDQYGRRSPAKSDKKGFVSMRSDVDGEEEGGGQCYAGDCHGRWLPASMSICRRQVQQLNVCASAASFLTSRAQSLYKILLCRVSTSRTRDLRRHVDSMT